jgi:hypothetical protein
MIHSSIVGGSTADRLLQCPASFQATLALPPSADKPSEFAEEGTAMHHAMDHLGHLRFEHPKTDLFEAAESMLGETVYDRKLTREHLDVMILPALTRLQELEDLHGGGFEVLGVELAGRFPDIPGAHGTCDLVLASRDYILHVDWKFGQGVPVKAVYKDDAGDRLNPQLAFYAVATMHSFPQFYKKKKRSVVAIIQPRTAEPLTYTEIDQRDVQWFKEDLQQAVERALDREAPRNRGEHCRFAPCKINCPLWTGPLLDLSRLSPPPQRQQVDKMATPYGEYLARAKALVDVLATMKKEVDEQLHTYLEAGGIVPGWRLKQKAKQRQWVAEETVAKTLKKLGFKDAEIWQRKLQTFQSTDATARRLQVKIPEELRVAPPTTETTIAPADDPAPVVDRGRAVEAFATALKKLQAGE